MLDDTKSRINAEFCSKHKGQNFNWIHARLFYDLKIAPSVCNILFSCTFFVVVVLFCLF